MVTGVEGPDILAQSFGRRLAKLREAAGMDMVVLGERAGTTKAYVWRVENGRTLPSLRTATRLAAALGIPLSTLVEGIEVSDQSGAVSS